VTDVTYQKPQFQHQDIFRTITVAFQPYIPFSQAYRMKLMGGDTMLANKMTAGRGTAGYFHWAPEDEPSETNLGEMGKYPWFVRRMAYGGQGMGRLAAMSVNPIREKKVLEKVDGIQGEGSAKIMGEQLRTLLDTGEAFEVARGEVSEDSRYDWAQRGSRDPLELELKEVVSEMGVGLDSAGVAFKDRKYVTEGMRDPFTEGQVRPGERVELGALGGFDIPLEDMHESFGDFLDDEIKSHGLGLGSALRHARSEDKEAMEQFGDENIHSLEVSRAIAKADKPSKLLTGFTPGKRKGDKLKDAWITHLDKEISEWNAEIALIWSDIMQQAGGWPGDGNMKDPYDAFFAVREKLGTPKEYKKTMGKGVTDAQIKRHASLREMTHRLMLDAWIALQKEVSNTQHLWTAPLGDNLGMTVLWPEMKFGIVGGRGTPGTESARFGEMESGKGRREKIDTEVAGEAKFYKWPVPQIGWSRHLVTLLPIDKGDIVMAYDFWLKSKKHLDDAKQLDMFNAAVLRAHGISTATKLRLAASGKNMLVRVSDMSDTGVLVRFIETRQLRPTAMAQALYEQINDYYQSGQRRQEVKDWYTSLMDESNKLTRQWFDAQEMGQGPSVGTPNLMNTTRSSEYVVGDDLGNPRKHYLGVWSDRLQDTWQGVELGAKDAVGYNFAIAPFITSRRAGTALFGSQKAKKGDTF